MKIDKDHILDMLYIAFPDADIELEDFKGDGDHYALFIKSAKFNKLSRVAQHSLVYDALKGMVGSNIHAMKIKTEVK